MVDAIREAASSHYIVQEDFNLAEEEKLELNMEVEQTPEVASAVLGIFLRTLRAALRDASPGAPAALRDTQLGAISFRMLGGMGPASMD